MGTGITILLVFIAVVVTLLIAVPVTRKIAVDNKIKQDAEKIGTAEEKARNIIDEALKTAETKKREALLEAKEESLRTKNEVSKRIVSKSGRYWRIWLAEICSRRYVQVLERVIWRSPELMIIRSPSFN